MGRTGLESIIATQAIGNVLATHSRGVDRADDALLASAYHDDATVDYGFFSGSASEYVGVLCAALRGKPITLHRTSNIWIRVAADSARSESYVLAYMEDRSEAGAIQRWIGGRYLDTHEKRGGTWALSHRVYVMDFNINRDSTQHCPPATAELAHFAPRGGHGRADPGRTLLALFAANLSGETAVTLPNADPSHNADMQLRKVLAHQALHELNMAYARAADRADAELMASIFHPDATVVAGVYNCDGARYAHAVTAFIRENLTRCFHSVANEWFDIRGDEAVGESYVIAAVTAGGNDVLTAGRYVDAYACRGGVWKITHRVFVEDWNSAQPTSHQVTGMYAALETRGRFGTDDPVYGFWKTPASSGA